MALGDIIGSIIGSIVPDDLSGLGSSALLLEGVPNVLGAWSMKVEVPGYTGPIIRVLRTSDSAEVDVYAGSDGWLDESAVAAHCGAAVGEIVTWYDQSGAGNDMPAAAGRPLIWDGASVHTLWGRPAALCDQSGPRNFHRSDTLGMIGNPSFDIFGVAQPSGALEAIVYLGSGAPGGTTGCLERNGDNMMFAHLDGNLIADYGGVPSTAGSALHFRGATGDTYADGLIWGDGSDAAFVSSANPASVVTLANDGLYLGGGFNMTGPLQTAIVCSSPSPGYAMDIATASAVRDGLHARYATALPVTANLLEHWGLRREVASWSGPLVRVQRASDSAELDIFPGVDGWVDAQAIADHCGASEGRVSVLYGQHGSQDLSQSTYSAMATIYDGTAALLATPRGTPELSFGGGQTYARADALGLTGNAALDVYFTGRSEASKTMAIWFVGGSAGGSGVGITMESAVDEISTRYLNGFKTFVFPGLDILQETNVMHLRVTAGETYEDPEARMRGIDGAKLSGGGTNTCNISDTGTYLGRNSGGHDFFVGRFQSLSVYGSATGNALVSADALAVESHLAAEYTAPD